MTIQIRMTESRFRLSYGSALRVALASLASVAFSCATYQDSNNAPLDLGGTAGQASSNAGSAGMSDSNGGTGDVAGMTNATAGSDSGLAGSSAGSPAGGSSGSGTSGSSGSAGKAGAGAAGSSSVAGSGGKGGSAGSSGAGTAGQAGSGGSLAGSGGSAGSAAGAGNAGSAGTAGSAGAVDRLLSEGKPSSADSEEVSQGHLAGLGNDGSLTTRWCASDGAAGHNWKVDLGAVRTLSKIQLTWEKAAVYKFKVEGSPDGTTWPTVLLDQTNSTNSVAAQTYPLTGSPTARWVRITVTALPNSTTWASFFEFAVYGH